MELIYPFLFDIVYSNKSVFSFKATIICPYYVYSLIFCSN